MAGFGGASHEYATLAKTGGMVFASPPDLYRVTLQNTAMPDTVLFARAHKPGVEKGTRGLKAAGSKQKVCPGILWDQDWMTEPYFPSYTDIN